MRHLILAFTVVFVFAEVGTNSANGGIILSFDSLPSAQGWTFFKSNTGSHADDTETGTFSVASNTLTMNTMGSGLVSPSQITYQQIGVVDPTLPWRLESRLRIVQHEASGGNPNFTGGGYFRVSNGESGVSLFLSDDDISYYDGATTLQISNDNTVFQDFRIEYTPDAGTGTYDLFIDDVLKISATARSTTEDRIAFGDGSGAVNAEWEMTSYSVSSVPEPSSMVLLLTAAAVLAGYRWRHRGQPFP